MGALGTAVAQIVVGLIEALFGRKLFWLFVAIGGFLIGWFLVPAIYGAVNDGATLELWTRVVIGVTAGLVLGFLAIKFTKFMVSLAGFFIFGTATVLVVRYFGAQSPQRVEQSLDRLRVRRSGGLVDHGPALQLGPDSAHLTHRRGGGGRWHHLLLHPGEPDSRRPRSRQVDRRGHLGSPFCDGPGGADSDAQAQTCEKGRLTERHGLT